MISLGVCADIELTYRLLSLRVDGSIKIFLLFQYSSRLEFACNIAVLVVSVPLNCTAFNCAVLTEIGLLKYIMSPGFSALMLLTNRLLIVDIDEADDVDCEPLISVLFQYRLRLLSVLK